MLFTSLPIVTLSKEEQPVKQLSPIVIGLLFSSNFFREEQLANALSPIVKGFSDFSKVREFREEQLANALSPMLSKEDGTSKEVKAVLLKALEPMELMFPFNLTEERFVQLLNAPSGMDVSLVDETSKDVIGVESKQLLFSVSIEDGNFNSSVMPVPANASFPIVLIPVRFTFFRILRPLNALSPIVSYPQPSRSRKPEFSSELDNSPSLFFTCMMSPFCVVKFERLANKLDGIVPCPPP